MSSAAAAQPLPGSVQEQVERILAEHLGRKTAATAVKIASRTWLRVEPEAIRHDQLGPLRSGLEPMLKTLLGADVAGALLQRIAREVVP